MPYPTYSANCDPCTRHPLHQDIQARAYSLWEAAGKPEGMRTPRESWKDYFWSIAEEEAPGPAGHGPRAHH